MSSYTVRVELHSNHYPDFVTLHSAMQQGGFSQLITGEGGKMYHLPRAEYNIHTIKSRSEVLSATKRAVNVTGKTAEILVTESAGRSWDGLAEKK